MNKMRKIFENSKLCFIIIAAFMFLTIVSSCAGNVSTPSGNVSNYGYVIIDKNDIYYTKTVADGDIFYSNIYKYNTKSGTELLVSSTEAAYPDEMNAFMAIDNGELYFLTNFINDSGQEYSSNISKVKPDGKNTKPQKLFEEDISCSFMQIVSGVIYYYDDAEQALYRVNTNGTKKQLLCEAYMSAIAVGGDKIYYAEFEKLMSVSVNGGEPKEVYDLSEKDFYIESLILDGNYLYYMDDSYSVIGRIKTDGKDNQEIYKVSESSSAYIINFNIDGGTVYFTLDEYGAEGNYAILSVVPGSKSTKAIVSDSSELGDISPLAIWNGTIYFFGMPIYETIMESDYVWFTVKSAGGDIVPFQPLTVYKGE